MSSGFRTQGNQMARLFILLLTLISSLNSLAESYYTDHSKGWHWYDDPKEQPKQKVEQPKELNATQQVSNVRDNVKLALDTAILNPTPDNVQHYLQLQNQLNQRADQLSTVWQQVLLTHPELNYSLSHPTNQIGIQVHQAEESKEKDAALNAFKQQYGLFFFYKSTCPYCKRFAPILTSFAERNGIAIIPITIDGISLPEFPNSKADTGQAQQFHVTMTPALFAVNPYTNKAFPVAYGLTSETELRDNIYKIMTQYQGVRT